MIFHGHIYSKVLEMDTGISVLGPNPDPARPYQVAYVLHGLCGNSESWTEYTMLPDYARGYNVLFVMPEVNRSFYSDQKIGQRYFTYVSRELPEIISRLFKVSDKREDTGLIGASMGGYGALKIALSRPDRYAYCAVASSACLFLKAELEENSCKSEAELTSAFGPQLRHDLEAVLGPELKWSEEHEIMSLMEKAPCGCKPKIFHCCGTEDYMYASNKAFSEVMRRWHAFDYTYREWPGRHNWFFFNEFIRQAIEFYFAKNQQKVK